MLQLHFPQSKDEMVAAIMTIVSLLLSIALHEYGHAKTADFLGDDTPRHQGRVTLNPLAHWDPIGTLGILITVFAGFGIGWGKPVETRPVNYVKTSMRAGMWLVTAAGPLTNLVLAMLFAIPIRLGWLNGDAFSLLWASITVQVNIGLFLFNLLPVPPLDGSKLILPLFDKHTADRLMQQYQTWGMFMFMVMILLQIPRLVLAPAAEVLTSALLGQPQLPW